MLDEFGLALCSERILLDRHTEDFFIGHIPFHVGGPFIRCSVQQAHALRSARIIAGEFLLARGHCNFGVTIFFREAVTALRKIVPKTFAIRHLLDHRDHRIVIAELQRHPNHIFGDVTLLIHLHRSGDCHAGGDGIHAVLIA